MRHVRRATQPNERGAPELKATLLQRFAAQYVALSVPYGHQLHRPTRPSDQYMALFNTALAEATVRGLCCVSTSQLKANGRLSALYNRTQLVARITQWSTAVCSVHSHTGAHWPPYWTSPGPEQTSPYRHGLLLGHNGSGDVCGWHWAAGAGASVFQYLPRVGNGRHVR
jgi:hypothetical protein